MSAARHQLRRRLAVTEIARVTGKVWPVWILEGPVTGTLLHHASVPTISRQAGGTNPEAVA